MLSIRISEQAEAGRGRAAREPGNPGRRDVRPAHLLVFATRWRRSSARPDFHRAISAPEFNEAVEIARATWNWESGQLLGTTAAAGDWRGIFARLSSLETAAAADARLGAADYGSLSGLRQLGPRAMLAAARVGSLATLIYGTRMRNRFLLGRDRIGQGSRNRDGGRALSGVRG